MKYRIIECKKNNGETFYAAQCKGAFLYGLYLSDDGWVGFVQSFWFIITFSWLRWVTSELHHHHQSYAQEQIDESEQRYQEWLSERKKKSDTKKGNRVISKKIIVEISKSNEHS